MQTLIAAVGILVTVLVVVGMVLMAPRNLERVVRADAGPSPFRSRKTPDQPRPGRAGRAPVL